MTRGSKLKKKVTLNFHPTKDHNFFERVHSHLVIFHDNMRYLMVKVVFCYSTIPFLTSSVFKSYRKKVRLWLLFTRTPAQLQGPRVLSRLTGPAWDAFDGLEPEMWPLQM